MWGEALLQAQDRYGLWVEQTGPEFPRAINGFACGTVPVLRICSVQLCPER